MILIVAALLLGSVAPAAAQEDGFFANTKKRGRAAVEYRDAEIHAVAAYYYSQHNHDSRWLLIQVAMSTSRNQTFDRKDITLVAPGGRAVELSSQEQFAADANRVRSVIQSGPIASVTMPERRGLLSAIQRRGVTPLVLFWNFSGQSS